MLHEAEEWKVIGHHPKIKMMKEHGRHLRLDGDPERILTTGALACNWRPRTRELFQDIVISMRGTGMRNERDLFRMRIENPHWQNRVIFVPDSLLKLARYPVEANRIAAVFSTYAGWI